MTFDKILRKESQAIWIQIQNIIELVSHIHYPHFKQNGLIFIYLFSQTQKITVPTELIQHAVLAQFKELFVVIMAL